MDTEGVREIMPLTAGVRANHEFKSVFMDTEGVRNNAPDRRGQG